MAENSAGSVFIELGLDISKMESDFVHVDETISQNLSRLNRESNLIQIHTEVEIGNLDQVNDAEKILELRTQALNKQLEIQRDRIRLVEAAHKELVNSKGADAAITQKMEMRLERERIGLQRVESKLRDVAKAQQELNSANNTGDKNRLLSIYDNLKGDILGKLGDLSGGFGALGKVTQAADGAITKTLETIGKIPAPVAAAATALVAIPTAVKAAESAILSLAEPAVTAGDAFYVMSRGLQMSIQETEELSMICKVTGIDINEVINVTRRLNMQIAKGGESAEKFKKWGIEIRNANGELKNAYELSVSLAEALRKAQAEGNGKDFIASILGKGASGDFVTYLEDLAGNIELAKTVVRNGLFDPVAMHNLQGNINTMNAQAEQLDQTFSSALTPVTDKLVPKLTERMGDLTKVIENNADAIKNFGMVAGEAVDGVADITNKTVNFLAKVADWLVTPQKKEKYALYDKYKDDKDVKEDAEVTKFKELKKAAEEAETAVDKAKKAVNRSIGESDKEKNLQSLEEAEKNLEKILNDYEKAQQKMLKSGAQNTFQKIWKKYLDDMDSAQRTAFLKSERQVKIKQDELRVVAEMVEEYQNQNRLTEEQIEKEKNLKKSVEEREESVKRIEKYSDELAKIKLDLQFGDNTYKKSLAELDLWHKEALNKAQTSAEERLKVEELYSAKLAKIQQETKKNISALNSETAKLEFARTHSEFEKQLRDIELWKQAQLEKARTAEEVAAIIKNSAEKETQAFEKEMDRIRGKTQTLAEKIFEKTHSKQEIDIMRAQKEYTEMLKEGIYNPVDLEFYRDISIGDILANNDRNYRRRPKLNFATTDTDYYADLQSAVDNVINSYKYLSPQDKIDNDLKNIPTQPLKDINAQINMAVTDFESGIGTAADSAILFANSVSDSANKIAEIQFQPPLKIPEDKNPAPPELPNKDFNFDNFHKALSDITQAFQKIAQDLSNVQTAQPPVINVSPNININLGGAYVFDNAMKAQLTDDIATDVANEITVAVQRAANDLKFYRRG